MDKKLAEYLKEITEASKNGNLVFFIGAGVSSLSEYPQWRQLVDRFYEELYGVKKVGEYSQDEYLRIPQMFYDVNGKVAYDQILKEIFHIERSTNQIHDKILAMNPVHIITTNYDNLIDTACLKRGKYFSVISGEEDVAKATSSRYLIKVHGDFRRGYKGENIVLKEDDYLNYEQNFPLISNLMKSIIATHTIVFIGYGLGDYNINMLLNWVKTLQRDSYHKPFFIRTNPTPIESETLIYYEKKGLRIIDAASLIGESESSYLERYSTVMDLLIDSRENKLISSDDEMIDYIYERLSPLFSLQYVRKIDLKYVFEYDYEFLVNGKVVLNKNKGYRYMERFFEIRNHNEISNLSEEKYQKFKEISIFFNKNGISGMLNDSSGVNNVLMEVENPAFHSRYDEMEKFIEKPSENLEDDYKKAFFLACLGRLEESYYYYSNVILKSINESNWCLHYLSQINRFWIYQSILTIDWRYKPFTDEFISCIETEMKNFNINNLFTDMPFEFQKKYKILEFLSDNKFLYDDTVKLFELTNKVRSEILKGSYTFGLSADVNALLRLYDNLHFLYENYLWFVSFKEFHQYVWNTISLLIEKVDFERTRDLDEFGLSFVGSSKGYYIDYHDFVSISKTVKVEDIKNIEQVYSIDQIIFSEQEKIEEYLVRLAEELTKNLKNIVFYSQLISEVKTAFYFAKYVNLSVFGFEKIVKALLYYIPENELDIGKRYIYLKRLAVNNKFTDSIIHIIEDFLVLQTKKHNDPTYHEMSSNNIYSKEYGALIKYFKKDFNSEKLSEIVLNLKQYTPNQIDFLYSLLPLLSSKAKDHLLSLKKIDNIHDIMNGIEVGIIEEITPEYEEIIIRYLEKEKLQLLVEKEMGVHVLKSKNYLITIGILFFLKKLNNPKIKEFEGINNQFDFFVNPENFDYNNFIPSWLKNYSKGLLNQISKNEHMKHQIIEILKERVKNSNDKRYLEILINHFV